MFSGHANCYLCISKSWFKYVVEDTMKRAVQKPRWALVGIQAVKSDFFIIWSWQQMFYKTLRLASWAVGYSIMPSGHLISIVRASAIKTSILTTDMQDWIIRIILNSKLLVKPMAPRFKMLHVSQGNSTVLYISDMWDIVKGWGSRKKKDRFRVYNYVQ